MASCGDLKSNHISNAAEMDLSRLFAAPNAGLSDFSHKSDRAFQANAARWRRGL